MRPCQRLKALSVAHTSVRFGPNETVFARGDRCAAVMYIQKGRVKLSVTSPRGREAVVAVLRAGTFFGEGALARQPRRKATASTMTAATVAVVSTGEMRRRLRDQTVFADWFRSHLLARNIRIEADLVGEVFNGSEQRLARLLLVLASFDEHQLVLAPLPVISRNLLADLVGTTRWKIDELMKDFRKRGFLERQMGRHGGLRVHRSMLTVVLQD